jgi:ABC-type nitrate/sulfonate/bicarbonate transport system permease component
MRPSRLSAFYVANERSIIGAGSLAIFLVLWETISRAGLADPMFVSSPVRVARAGAALLASGEIWGDLKVSALEFVLGYAGAALIAIPLGLALGWSKRLQYVFGPFVDTLNAVPRVTLLPLIIIWFGIGIWSKVVVVFLGAVIPILISTQAGVRTNEARFLKVARSFGASELKVFVSIILPGTVPFIFTGLKYGAGRALLGVVVGELYASTAGVGHMIADAGNTFQTDLVFVGVLIFTASGLATVGVLNRLERRFDNWRPKVGAAA